jgi:hypothetical protein
MQAIENILKLHKSALFQLEGMLRCWMGDTQCHSSDDIFRLGFLLAVPIITAHVQKMENDIADLKRELALQEVKMLTFAMEG